MPRDSFLLPVPLYYVYFAMLRGLENVHVMCGYNFSVVKFDQLRYEVVKIEIWHPGRIVRTLILESFEVV